RRAQARSGSGTGRLPRLLSVRALPRRHGRTPRRGDGASLDRRGSRGVRGAHPALVFRWAPLVHQDGRERPVELSKRLVSAIAALSPDAFGDDALVFPGEEGGFLDPHNFRARVFRKLVERELGKGRDFTPHGLRHTFASLHLARGSNLKWIQAMGGWASAKLLLDLYGHHLRTENAGYADVLSQAPKQVPIASTPRGTDPLTDPRASARPLATNMPPECRAKSRRSARGCAGAPGGNRTPTGMK